MEATGNHQPRSAPTLTQLRRGAGGISYRADQLASAVLLWTRFAQPPPPGPTRNIINNCRIESALVHARALSGFLMEKPGRERYLHHSHYRPWLGKVSAVTGRIFGAVSNHLAHPSLGDEGDEPYPGSWPLTEMAQALLGGLADFIHTGTDVTDTYDPGWFTPSPVVTFLGFGDNLHLLPRTDVSEHPEVGKLTETLHTYLGDLGKGVIPRPDDPQG